MRDVSEPAFMFLIALTWVIYSVPTGSRRVRGLIGMITTLCALGVLHFGPIRAPIGAGTEFVLDLLFAGIIIALALRIVLAGPRTDAGAKVERP
jgi:hypothetical protein